MICYVDPDVTSEAPLSCGSLVEAIGTYSNRGHLCKKMAELRNRINETPVRPPLLHQNDSKPRSKRFLTAKDITDIARRYEAGDITQRSAIATASPRLASPTRSASKTSPSAVKA